MEIGKLPKQIERAIMKDLKNILSEYIIMDPNTNTNENERVEPETIIKRLTVNLQPKLKTKKSPKTITIGGTHKKIKTTPQINFYECEEADFDKFFKSD